MLLQTGPRFVVPFATTAGLGTLLVVAAGLVYWRFADGGGGESDDSDGVDPLAVRAAVATLAAFGLGLVAIALDFAGTMAGLQTRLDRPDGTPMKPSLVGEVGLAAPWETVALALFVGGAVAAVVGTAVLVRNELRG
ncbi:hypothetical protein [Halorarius litoreus]|uniref:hypothetical protein n=1 Tax=Halorarius litoreus TaxID=2962676 RepID=UPI0020CC9D14|nr:hypothetical protein [Halorarius litoreus]